VFFAYGKDNIYIVLTSVMFLTRVTRVPWMTRPLIAFPSQTARMSDYRLIRSLALCLSAT